MTNPELRAALIAAFPAAPITRATIDTTDASWAGYEQRDELASVETASWAELAPEVLEHHARLLVHAGGALFRAILPAYLQYLLALPEHDSRYGTSLPYIVATQLTRKDASEVDREIFEQRVGPMTADQRAVVRQILQNLAGDERVREALREALSVATRSW